MSFLVENFFLILLVLVSGGALLWPTLQRGMGGGASVNTLQATQLINGGAVVVDVREASERASGAVAGSKHIPLGEFVGRISELDKYKGKPVIVVCASGARSSRATSALRKAGFEQAVNLEGGVAAWQAAGLPLSRKGV